MKALPWAIALQAGMAARDRWQGLSEKDRTRLTQLLRDSRGRPGNLSAKEREELRKLTRRLDVTGMGRELLGLVRGSRGRKRR